MSETKPTCDTCRYFKKTCGAPGSHMPHQCVRRSPAWEGWPLVRPDEWCGEHEPADEQELERRKNLK